MKDYLNIFRKGGFNIELKKNGARYILFIEKNIDKKLDLKLAYDKNSSMDLQKISAGDPCKTAWGAWWGTRSVFNANNYKAL